MRKKKFIIVFIILIAGLGVGGYTLYGTQRVATYVNETALTETDNTVTLPVVRSAGITVKERTSTSSATEEVGSTTTPSE